MPTVRAYRDQVRSPQLRPVADTSIPEKPSPDVYGAQVGRAVEGVGQTVAAVGEGALAREAARAEAERERAREQAERDAVIAGLNDGDEADDPILNEAQSVQGADAVNWRDRVRPKFDENTKKIAAGLPDRARVVFEQKRMQRWGEVANRLSEHGRVQYDKWAAAEAKEGLDNTVSRIIQNADNPQKVAELFAEVRSRANNYATGRMGPEATASLIGEYTTKGHVGVIKRLIDSGQDLRAKEYFESHRTEIDGQQLDGLEKGLREGSIRGEAQKQADVIIAAGGSLSEQRDKAKAIKNSDVRDRALTYIEHEAELRDSATLQADRQKHVDIGNLIDKGGLGAVSPSVWSTLTVDQKENYERYAKRNVKAGDPDGKTDLVMYYGLMKQAATDPDAFAKLNLAEPKYLARLSKTDYKQVVGHQASILKGDKPKAEKDIESFTTTTQVWNDILHEFNMKEDDPRALRLRREIDKRFEGAQQDSDGKKLTHTEVRKMADDLMQSVVLQQGSWWNLLGRGRTGTLLSDVVKPIADLTINDIPIAERQKIEKRLRADGRPTTPDMVLDWYVRAKRALGQVK